MKIKRRSILFFIIAIFLFVPYNVHASDGETDQLYININIREDGSIKVQELANLQGEYNGRLRNIEFANLSAAKFTGSESDFEGSDIYNGSSIMDLKIYDIPKSNSMTFDSLDGQKGTLYREVSSAFNGQKGVYERTDYANGIKLKIYNPSNTNTSFYMEYIVNDVVVVHNDVAELAWNLLGTNYEDNIYDMEVHIHLPREDQTSRVWLRGPLNGNIENIDHQYAKITYSFLGARNAVSARVMFDKELVPNATKKSGVNGKENILKVEQQAAEKANSERERIRRENQVVKRITISWYILLILLVVLCYKKKKRCETTSFDQDYLRDFPANYGPEIVGYLMDQKVAEEEMSASILMMIEKKALKVEQDPAKKDNFTLILQEKEVNFLTEQEKKLQKLLIEDIGDGAKVTLDQIKKYGKSTKKAEQFIKSYDNWKKSVKEEGKKEAFFFPLVKIQVIGVMISLLGTFLIFFLNIIFDTSFIPGYLSLLVGIIAIIWFSTRHFRTEKGSLHYKQWMALKKFMVDFGTMDEKELPELKIWGKYLVYASVLGCAKQLEKTMKIKMENMNLTEEQMASYYLNDSFADNIFIMSTLTSSIHNSVQTAVSSSRSSIASSSSSSGGGFGGGASFGGGSFGGGGGGGHF